MTDWLVRTAQNRLLGPMAEAELKQRIQAGEFRLEDEICRGDDYWIFLHEREEVKARLGFEAPVHRVLQEDETETGTRTVTDTTLPGRKKPAPATGRKPIPAVHGAPAPEPQTPILALLLTLGGLGVVIFVVFMLRAVWLVGR